MKSILVEVIAPFLFVSLIALFVVLQMKRKHSNRAYDNKERAVKENFYVSALPLGMIVGVIIAVVISMFTNIALISIIPVGAAIGFLIGYLIFDFLVETKLKQ